MFNQGVWLKCLRPLALNSKTRLGHTASGTPPQYDVSEKVKKLFEIKQKQRENTKAYFQKIIMNPYRPKEDAVPFDPVLFRYNALMTYNIEYFKPNLKNGLIFYGFYVFPMIALYWIFTTLQENRERKIRAGEVAYKDRNRGLL